MLKKSLVVITVLFACLIIPTSSFASSGKLQKVKTSCTVSPEGASADVQFQATMFIKYNRFGFNIKKVNYFYNVKPTGIYQQIARPNKWKGSLGLKRRNVRIKDSRIKSGLAVKEAGSFRTNWNVPAWERDTQVSFAIKWESLTKEAVPYGLPPTIGCSKNFPFKQLKK